jgi:hypothetical protein
MRNCNHLGELLPEEQPIPGDLMYLLHLPTFRDRLANLILPTPDMTT